MIGIAAAAPASARQDAPPDPAAHMVPLSDKPYEAPALGVSFYLPEDSVVTAQAISVGTGRLQVQPRGKEWMLQVYNQRSTNENLTLTQVVDSIIEQRQHAEADAQKKFGQLIDPRTRKPIVCQPFERNDNLTIAGVPAARVYLGYRHVNTPDPAADPFTTSGFTVFRTGPGEFLISQFDTPDTEFDRAKLIYETIMATAVFKDMSALQAERAAAVLTGTQLLDSLTQQDLESLLDTDAPTFIRMYEPSPTGAPADDTEVAWQRIEIRKGQLGELSLTKRPVDWNTAEREFGYLALLTAAYASPDGSSIQLEARYFLSFDRQRETWFVQNRVRQSSPDPGDPPHEFQVSQTVVREGRRLTASVVHSEGAPATTEFDLPESGYISKVELMLLPRIIASRQVSGLFGFYTFDSRLGQVVLRRDTFERTDLGNWSCVTRETEDAREVRSTFDRTGRLLRQTLPEGRIAEPIDPQRLLKLWNDKGLTK